MTRDAEARWLVVRSLITSALLAAAGWVGLMPWSWLNKVALIAAGLGYGAAMVKADRLRRAA